MTQHVLSLSYGKDSLACLGAIEQLGWTLDRIVHVEVWATDTIPADLPPMVEFKKKADAIIKERWGIDVEHICALKKANSQNVNVERERESFESIFYRQLTRGKYIGNIKGFPNTKGSWCKHLKYGSKVDVQVNLLQADQESGGRIYGFPMLRGNWCNTYLKSQALRQGGLSIVPGNSKRRFSNSSLAQGADINIVQYLGIAADETARIEKHAGRKNYRLPLVEIGWDEAYCRKWCEDNDLLSPIYTTSTRGGCWFCHNQGIDQLRFLRKNYPDLWQVLLKWDADSPTTFHSDGHTVHDFEKRFALEDIGAVPTKNFRWKMLDDPLVTGQMKLF